MSDNILKHKNSQVTLFIIIAMMILVMLVILMISYSSLTKKTFNIGNNKLIDSNKVSDQVNTFMTDCLSNSLNEYLLNIGAQGGFILKNQKGSIINFDIPSAPAPLIVSHNDATVKYFNVSFINGNLPDAYVMSGNSYPCLNQTYSKQGANYITKYPQSVRGVNCTNDFNVFMANNAMILSAISYYQRINNSANTLELPLCSQTQVFNNSGNLAIVCAKSPNEAKNKISIQNQGEKYINYKLEECLDEARNTFLQQINATITTLYDFNTTMVFGDRDTSVTSRTHLKLIFAQGQTDMNEQTLYAQANVRIKTIYALLYGDNLLIEKPLDNVTSALNVARKGIIDLDFQDPAFDVNTDSFSLMNSYSITNISIVRTYDEFGSLITVTDNDSNLFGLPYTYRVRESNRKPMLDSVRKSLIGDYNYYGYVGDYLIINPIAHDLDDEGASSNELRYDYAPIDKAWKDSRSKDFTDSELYLDGKIDIMNISCFDEKYGITINRCANIFLNKSDLGPHSIEITVHDKRSSDAQRVTIFVDQQPSVSFAVKHIYDDAITITPDGKYIVSTEDPFIINTSGSFVSAGPFETDFTWEDTTLPPSKITFADLTDPKYYMKQFNYPVKWQTKDTIIVHPGYKNYSLYANISKFFSLAKAKYGNLGDNENVKKAITQTFIGYYSEFNISKRDGYPINVTGYNAVSGIKLSYLRSGRIEQDKSVIKDILIAECIPHRSDTPSYPFNLIRTVNNKRDINPYLGNHTCCEDTASATTWRVKSKNTICYNSFELGTYGDFILDKDKNISYELFGVIDPKYTDANIYPKLKPIVVPSFDNLNDKYARILVGKCDGVRGNVCEPDEYSIKKLPYCGTSDAGLSMKYNLTIGQTSISAANYYTGGLCTCRNYTFNVTDASMNPKYGVPTNKLYCCFDSSTKLPAKVSDKPCIVPDCAKYDIYSTAPVEQKIGNTVFTTIPGPYCKCGSSIVDTGVTSISNSYCCNPYRIKFTVEDSFGDCNLTSGTSSHCPETCSYIVSDATVKSNGVAAMVASPIPLIWSAVSYTNASWIKDKTLPKHPATANELMAFKKSFTITLSPSAKISKGVLQIDSDNESSITLNGNYIGDSPKTGLFLSGDIFDVRKNLVVGTNTLEIDVTNIKKLSSTTATNPAGLIFNLEVCTSLCNNTGSTINSTPKDPEVVYTEEYDKCMSNDNLLMSALKFNYQNCIGSAFQDSSKCTVITEPGKVMPCTRQAIIDKALYTADYTICDALSLDYKKLCRGMSGYPTLAETECPAKSTGAAYEICVAVRNDRVSNCSDSDCENFYYTSTAVFRHNLTSCNSVGDYLERLACPAIVDKNPALCDQIKQNQCAAYAASHAKCYSSDLAWCSKKINPAYNQGLVDCVEIICGE